MNLTEHFTLEEFEYSSTAISKGIDNRIPHELIPSIRNLCEQVLEPLRQQVKEPVIISSGYRCPELNRLVGGVPDSQHLTGEACDIYLEDRRKLRDWFLFLEDHTNFDQLLWERQGTHHWIHVSCKPDITQNRHQVFSLTKTLKTFLHNSNEINS